MKINEFKAARALMENKILVAVAGIVANFEKETGYSPCRIDIRMASVTAMGDTMAKHIVSEVSTDVII